MRTMLFGTTFATLLLSRCASTNDFARFYTTTEDDDLVRARLQLQIAYSQFEAAGLKRNKI
jgi:hypothetical protein